MGLPRYENIDQLPSIAMAVRGNIQYIIQRIAQPVPDLDALAEMEAIIEYLLYLLSLYQLEIMPVGDQFLLADYLLVDGITAFATW